MSDQPTKTESDLSDDTSPADNAYVTDAEQTKAAEKDFEAVDLNAEETEATETTEAVVAVAADSDAAESAAETENAGKADIPASEAATSAEDPIKFEELALPEPLLKAITKLGFEECTPIQGRSLPFSLSDYDVTGQAQTGTGKTAAFLITLLTRFWENPLQERPSLGTPRALVLAPTRELAMQIEGDSKGLAKYMDMRTVCITASLNVAEKNSVWRFRLCGV